MAILKVGTRVVVIAQSVITTSGTLAYISMRTQDITYAFGVNFTFRYPSQYPVRSFLSQAR